MLSTAKPILLSSLQQIIYQSMYEAFKSTYLTTSDSTDDGNDMAVTFAKTASKKMAQPLADAIDTYVKSIGIMITPTTLIAPPEGPVTGMANTETQQIKVY